MRNNTAAVLLSLVLMIVALGSNPAHGHRPYIVKIKTLEGPSGEALILEKLYGDGILGVNPASLQLRNSKGAVIAYSPTGIHLGMYCPSLDFCFAYPYNPYSLLVPLVQLDYQNLEYKQTV